MKKKQPAARKLYMFCHYLKVPLLLLLLCTSAAVLYRSWRLVFYSKTYVSDVVTVVQNQNLEITDLTIRIKHTSSEGQQTKLSLGNRSSFEFHSAPSDVQDDSNSKPSIEGRSPPERHSMSSDTQDYSNTKMSSEKRSLSENAASLNTNVRPNEPERRRSLLIYGADRSGTTFTTKMFAEDPNIMTVYEPLWITKRWNREKEQRPKWKRNVINVVNGILSCNFAKSEAGTRFLKHTSRRWSGATVKNPFTSEAFCINKTCRDLSMDPVYADKVCLTKYKHSVTKVGEPRIPDKLISSLLPAVFLENPETDVRVIQLVRDPRGSCNSRVKLTWMPEYTSPRFLGMVREHCSKLVENIKFGRHLHQWKEKYLEVNYRDLARKPIDTTKLMYKFAGFEMPDSVLAWVVRNTSPSKVELQKQQRDQYSSVRNSTANVDKWKRESPKERVQIIEQECSEALDLMGLTKLAGI